MDDRDPRLSMYDVSIPLFLQYLQSTAHILDLAERHATEQRLDIEALLKSRLHPTMYTLAQQVCEALRHASVACKLLAGAEPPDFTGGEPDLVQLRERIARCTALIAAVKPDAINGSEQKAIAFTFRSGAQRQFAGAEYLLTFCLPQFFFHIATAYDILRHNGVPLAKKDFLGSPVAPN